jgi:tetratricopeptide (TPR) repeat protein
LTLPLYADTKNTIQLFTKAIQEDPKNPQAYFHRGKAYWEVGNYELAVEDFTKVLELNPKL